MLALPDISAIREAQKWLAQYFGATPLTPASSLARPGSEVFLKNETVLPTGSFKPRGALHALATNLKRSKIEEVTAASTGNHGAAVAFAARTLGVRATIFLPEAPNPVKRKKIEALGAAIVTGGSADLVGASQMAKEHSSRPGIYFLHDATDADLPAGAGTIGLELLDQLSSLNAVFVPMGDTALIRGIAAAIKAVAPSVQMIGVQAEQAPSYSLSWREGRAIPTDTCDTIADGLATRTPEEENVAAIRKVVDDVVLVSEARMLDAIRHLYLHEKVIAEPSGAATTAAWLDHPIPGRVALLVTGGNISSAVRQQAGI